MTDERFLRTHVAVDATITDAMRSLDVSLAQIVLVVDADGRLQGTLTDGDLRRALLGGAAMTAPVAPHMNTKFTAVLPDTGRVEVLEMMHARHISQVPVLDADGRVVGLHLLREMLAAKVRPNRAVVMAGGKGTRLAPLTDGVPKPMLRIAGRPILERIVLHLVGCGIRHVYLSVNHLAELIEGHFGDGSSMGCRIEYLREQAPLGTGGGLGLLPDRPKHPLVVMNGDLVTQADIGRMIDHHERGDHAVTLAVRKYLHQVPFGCVELRDHEVVAMAEKPMMEQVINAGIYVISPLGLDVINPAEVVTMPEIIQRIMAGGGRVEGYEIDDDWIDVGRRDELDRARGATVSLAGRTVLVTGADGFIGSHLVERLVHDGARVRAFCFYHPHGSWGWLDHASAEVRAALDVRLGDVRDARFVSDACRDVEVIFHLAALIAIPFSYVAPESFVQTNVVGTLNVLEAARNHRVGRLVQTSTSEVYGTPAVLPIREDHPLNAQSPYAATKIAADQLALAYHRSFEVPAVVLRPFNTYGPRQSARAVVPAILTQLLSGRTEIELGRLDPRRDLTFVTDTVDGFVRAGATDGIDGMTIQLGTGRAVSIQDVFELAVAVTGATASVQADPRRMRPDPSEVMVLESAPDRARAVLGWEPRVSLEDGLRQTADWLRTNLALYRPDLLHV